MRFANRPFRFEDGEPGGFDIHALHSSDPATDGGSRVETGEPSNEMSEGRDASAAERVANAGDVTVDPVTRVGGGGALAVHTTVDFDDRVVLDGQLRSTLFRGYERVLEGRDSRDAVDLSSRVCGFEGAAHSITSAMALEMAYPVEPPPLGVWARNMGQAAGFLLDLAGHLFLLAGPDYSEEALAETNPAVFAAAQETAALHSAAHGYETVGDIMTALTPMEGELYLEVLQKARKVNELASLVVGKYPHPSTAAPGGMTTTLMNQTVNQFYTILKGLADYAKKIPPLWDDLLDFVLEHVDGFEHVGEGPRNMLSVGVWDDPDVYNARYEDADEWGRARYATPGVIIDGELETTALTDIDAGIEEFVTNSNYEGWTDGSAQFDETPAGRSLSPHHPWNKETRPAPEHGSGTWGTAPRWRGQPMETGPHARQWITAQAEELDTPLTALAVDEVDNPLIEATGDGLNLTLPEVALPEATFRWDVPDRLNAAERLRATAYHIPYAGIVCYVGLLEMLALVSRGERSIHTSFTVPDSGTHRGVGFWETGRGALTHHAVLEKGTLDTYQILTPSTWVTSPKGPDGIPGPCEQAVMNTPILEAFDDREDYTGIDVLRAVRSFDPCMVCASH